MTSDVADFQHPSLVSWPDVWSSAANDLGESWSAGLGKLITEDVVRFALVKNIVAQGVPANTLEAEWRRPGVPDSVDLVVTTAPRAAFELKYPREPRETNAAWTQHLGEVLKDFYRLAYMPAEFQRRWCVQLLSPRVQRYLDGVDDRHGVRLVWRPGLTMTLQPGLVRALPATATGRLTRWLEHDRPVTARCVASHPVDELALVVYEVAACENNDSSEGRAGDGTTS